MTQTAHLTASWQTLEPIVRGYLARRLAGDDTLVDDLAQEVYLHWQRGLPTLRATDHPGPWLMRLTRNVLVDHVRRRRPLVAMPTSDPAALEPSPDHEDQLRAAGYLRQRIAFLPAHEAAAIRLVDLADVPPADAATQLGIGLPALKARLRRGRARLRADLTRCCDIHPDVRGQPTACEPRQAGACSAASCSTDDCQGTML
jgi:RNA polymerase sigma-70 factor (ECF subfamily)